MAEPITVDNGALTDYDVLVDDVTDGVLGAGAKQLVGLTDATIGSTTKVAAGGGVQAAALRVTVASDSSGVLAVTDNGGSLTVDNPVISVVGGGTEAAAQRVTIATDSTGVLSVDDNGGSLTVDGTVAVTGVSTLAEQQTQTASLSVLDDWDESDRAKVNPIAGQAGVQGASGVVTALTQRVVLATDVALPAGANAIGKLAANSGVDIGDVDVTTVGTITPGVAATSLGKAEDAVHASGDVGVLALAVRDTAPAANSGTDGDYETLHVSDEGGVWSAEVASSQGGTDVFRTLDADETEEDVKTSAGTLYGYFISNSGAAFVYVKLYNATAANVTVGSTTPVMTLAIPPSSSANWAFTPGVKFGTAICIAATTGVADADTTAPAANQVVANIYFK